LNREVGVLYLENQAQYSMGEGIGYRTEVFVFKQGRWRPWFAVSRQNY